MLFNSLDYALFLPIVFLLYWFVFNKSLKNQNVFLLLVSYFFYACWNWKFLFLIVISTFINYYFAKQITKNNSHSKTVLWTGISLNLMILGFFKYYNFFLENFVAVFRLFGTELNSTPLKIILLTELVFILFKELPYEL